MLSSFASGYIVHKVSQRVSVLNLKRLIHFAEKLSYQFPHLDCEKINDDERLVFSLGASENLLSDDRPIL